MSDNLSNFVMVAVGVGLIAGIYIVYKRNVTHDFDPTVKITLGDLFPGNLKGSTINELETKPGSKENTHILGARDRAINTIRRRVGEIADVPTDSFKVYTDLDQMSKLKDHTDCPAGVIYDTVQIMIHNPDIGDPLRGVGSVMEYEALALTGAKAYVLWSGIGAEAFVDLSDVC